MKDWRSFVTVCCRRHALLPAMEMQLLCQQMTFQPWKQSSCQTDVLGMLFSYYKLVILGTFAAHVWYNSFFMSVSLLNIFATSSSAVLVILHITVRDMPGSVQRSQRWKPVLFKVLGWVHPRSLSQQPTCIWLRPPLSFLQAGCPSCRPTNSIKALKTLYLKQFWKIVIMFCTYIYQKTTINYHLRQRPHNKALIPKTTYLSDRDYSICMLYKMGCWLVGCWCGYLSGARCRLAYCPADATATHCLLLQ